MESHPVSDPPTIDERESVRASIDSSLGDASLSDLCSYLSTLGQDPVTMVASGGMGCILAKMEMCNDDFDREEMEAVKLPLDSVTGWGKRLWGLPLGKRREITGLPTNRADIALYGSLIYEQIMRRFGFASMQVSTRGIRFGLFAYLITQQKRLAKKPVCANFFLHRCPVV